MTPLPNGRRAALDYGDVRIGVAVTDFHKILCSPLPFMRNDENLEQSIRTFAQEYEPVYWVVGLPLNLSGVAGESAQKVKYFLHQLSQWVDGDIYIYDERRSTLEASRKLREVGISAKDQKSLIDSMSAVSFLEAAIDEEKSSGTLSLRKFDELELENE